MFKEIHFATKLEQQRGFIMLKMIIFIATILVSSVSLAESETLPPITCLGFPSAVTFSCEYTPLFSTETKVLLVNIPAGSGCNQPPEAGTVVSDDQRFVIYNPTVSFDNSLGEPTAHLEFYASDLDSDTVTLTCGNVEM